MGCICDCLRYCCEETVNKKTEEKEKQTKNEIISDKKTVSPVIEFDTPLEADLTDKRLISEDNVKQEIQKSFKGGNSSYGSIKRRQMKNVIEKEEHRIVTKFLRQIKCDLIGICGSGQYADVFHIRHKEKRRDLALKVMDIGKVDQNYLNNFLPKELKILREMPKHQNLIRIYLIKEVERRIFIVMEFASKGTLTDWIKQNGAMTERVAQVVFPQILNGVDALHSINIAHRDLKLENILMTKSSNPKITDFSYAIDVDPNKPLSAQYCGSLPYFSPEILQRQPHNPLLSDIWSIGVCFYILLNDGLPFKLGDDSVMLQKQLDKDWKFRKNIEPNLSEDIKHIIKSLLEPKPELRPTTAILKSKNWFKNFEKLDQK